MFVAWFFVCVSVQPQQQQTRPAVVALLFLHVQNRSASLPFMQQTQCTETVIVVVRQSKKHDYFVVLAVLKHACAADGSTAAFVSKRSRSLVAFVLTVGSVSRNFGSN